MIRLFNYFIILSVAMLLSACSKNSTPADVAKESMYMVEKGDVSVKDLMSKQLVSTFGEEKLDKAIQEESKRIKEKGGIASIEVLDEKIEDTTATVKLKINYGNGTSKEDKSKLVKEDGKWKLTVSK